MTESVPTGHLTRVSDGVFLPESHPAGSLDMAKDKLTGLTWDRPL